MHGDGGKWQEEATCISGAPLSNCASCHACIRLLVSCMLNVFPPMLLLLTMMMIRMRMMVMGAASAHLTHAKAAAVNKLVVQCFRSLRAVAADLTFSKLAEDFVCVLEGRGQS